MHNIIVLGAPGSGKGTVSRWLATQYGFYHLATGDIIRQHIKNKTKLGQQCITYVSQALLVPDNLVTDMVATELKKLPSHKKIIWDGFPRTVAQANTLDIMLAQIKSRIHTVLYIDVDDETLLVRVAGRLVCPTCNRVYNVIKMPPHESNYCDDCHSQLESRSDDDPVKFKVRLQDYQTYGEALLKYYQQQEIVHHINGTDDWTKIKEEVAKMVQLL